MDINVRAEAILSRVIAPDKRTYFLSDMFLKRIVKKYALGQESKVAVFGYKRDVDRFSKCFPSKCNALIREYAKPENWRCDPGQEFKGEEQIHEIAQLSIDRLVIVSNDLRYLAQMYLIKENVSYEILDVYELIEREYKRVVVKSIANSPIQILKEYIKWGGVWLSERVPALNSLQCVWYWRKEKEKRCDNYDAILVKKFYAKKASDPKEKEYYLNKLIINYLLIRDYKSAFKYIDEYTNIVGNEENPFERAKEEFTELFSQIKEELQRRKEKDILIFWCDSMPYSDFKRWHFLENEAADSLQFENTYTHVPYTDTTSKAMFTGLPYYEGRMYRDAEDGNFFKDGKTIALLEEENYQICEIGENYTRKKYLKELAYTVKNAYPPAAMYLWESLAQMLDNNGKKKFIICHMDCELHEPYWNGESEEMYVGPTAFLNDLTKYDSQRRESAAYLEGQILWYQSFLGEKASRIFMSDHGLYWPPYSEHRLHAFCFIKDGDVRRGSYKEYFSYLHFYELITYILYPTEENFGRIFSDYALVQNDHPYSQRFCEEIQHKFENNEDLMWKTWIGFRGIIKEGYKLIRFPENQEMWLDMEDREILPDEIADPALVEFMRDRVGNEFGDLSDPHYRYTRKLYEYLKSARLQKVQ